MMTYISDTHALVWLLEGNPSLSPRALRAFSDPNAQIVIPAIVLAEVQFLYTRKRVNTDLQEVFHYIRQTPAGVVRRAPRWMQRYGLEWLWRLLHDPRKIAKVRNLPRFVWLVWREGRKNPRR